MPAISPSISPAIEPNQLATLVAAITPDHHSRSAYTGRVTQKERVTIIADDGTAFEADVSFFVSWDSISELLGIMKKRVGA